VQVIRCLLIVPFPESSLNDEAGKQFMESYEDYANRARLLTSVHAMRKMGPGESSSLGASGGPKGEAGEGGEGGEGSEVACPSPGGVSAKRKLPPNNKDVQAEKKLKETKRKGLKRL
jgi:ubiquitin-conjugating enzyme E2 S